MADDIRIEITGDAKDIKKVVKTAEKLVKRFEKANSKSTQRRVQAQKRAANTIQRVEGRNAVRIAAMDKRLSRKRARNRLRLMKENIRTAKREAAAAERTARMSMRNQAKILKRGAVAIALATAAAYFVAAKSAMKFDLALTKMAGTQQLTAKQQQKIRDSIMATSVETGTGRDAILEMIATIVDKSGDIDLASKNIQKFGKILAVEGEEKAGDIGELFAALSSNVGAAGVDVMEAFEAIMAVGNKGNVIMTETAANAKKLFGAFDASGLKGKKAFSEFFALFQQVGSQLDPAEATTAMKGFFRDIKKKSEELRDELGIEIYKDPKVRTNLKEISEIVGLIMEKTGGSYEELKKIGKVSDPIAVVFNAMASDMRKNNGEMRNFNYLTKLGVNSAKDLEQKYARVSQTSAMAWKRMQATLTLIGDEMVKGSIDEISNSLLDLMKDPAKLEALIGVAKAVGTMIKWIIKGGSKAIELFHAMGGGIGVGLAKMTGIDEEVRQSKLGLERQKILAVPKTERTPEQKENLQKIEVDIAVHEGRVADVQTKLKNPWRGQGIAALGGRRF